MSSQSQLRDNLLDSIPKTRPSQSKRYKRYLLMLKGLCCVLLISGFSLYRFLQLNFEVECIKDVYQDITDEWNRTFVMYPERGASYPGKDDNPLSRTGQVVIGIGQVMMDVLIVLTGVIWMVKVKNLRLFGAVAPYFLIRALVYLNVEQFPFPENIVWNDPGFPSFAVPYDHTRDFFYSGHTGSLTFIFLEFFCLELKVLSVVLGLSWCFMLNILLITKVHYLVDIVGGLIFSIWWYRTSIRYVGYMDRIISLPFVGGKKMYQRYWNKNVRQNQGRTEQPASRVSISQIRFRKQTKAEREQQQILPKLTKIDNSILDIDMYIKSQQPARIYQFSLDFRCAMPDQLTYQQSKFK